MPLSPRHARSAATTASRARSPEPRDATLIVQGLRRIVKALHSFSQDVYRQYGLTGPQLWALKTLQREGRLSAGQLAGALAVHQSSLSILVDRLEKRGLVSRVRSRGDGRFVLIELTKRGLALSTMAPEPAQGRLLHGLQAMSRAEVSQIRRAVDRLVRAMEAEDTTARFFFSDE
ncbi:MAG TPA: MarR family transcriptional regulator [Gemmatimonadales bacterium]|nr:MarR family transcriptional regulator [Gemmatimonadales bacterium]